MKDTLRDAVLCAAWIGGLILAGFLLWFFTQSLHERSLLKQANRIFMVSDESFYLDVPLSKARSYGKKSPPGVWYSLKNSNNRVFVFSMIHEGILLPCAAEVNPLGKVEKIVPLNLHASQIMKRLPHGVIEMWGRRVENCASPWEEL
jgi:hypothetical protein